MSNACARQAFGVVGAPATFHILAIGPEAYAADGGCNAALLVNTAGTNDNFNITVCIDLKRDTQF